MPFIENNKLSIKVLFTLLISILCFTVLTTSCNKPAPAEEPTLESIVFTNITNNALTLNEGETTVTARYNEVEASFTVYVREGNNDTEIFSETLSTVDFNYNEVDLSQFSGKTVKIVFRHHDSSDVYHCGLDNIAVANYDVEWVY